MTTKTKLPIGLMLILSLIVLFAVLQIPRLYYLFSNVGIEPPYEWGTESYPNPIFGILESVMFLCLSIYTIVSFIKLKSNALFLGKLLFGLLLLRRIALIIVFGLGLSSLWILVSLGALAYLFFSKQIQNLFPKEQRVICKIDVVIAIVAVIIVALSIIFPSGVWISFWGLISWG
ncbi:MAG: hypothetical protein LBI15_04735 [Dysgonamonadaceae bacterium]|jgi:hypothetical protein|nr:hypothetical protein [Dysgonamonadaceae bacterium]